MRLISAPDSFIDEHLDVVVYDISWLLLVLLLLLEQKSGRCLSDRRDVRGCPGTEPSSLQRFALWCVASVRASTEVRLSHATVDINPTEVGRARGRGLLACQGLPCMAWGLRGPARRYRVALTPTGAAGAFSAGGGAGEWADTAPAPPSPPSCIQGRRRLYCQTLVAVTLTTVAWLPSLKC